MRKKKALAGVLASALVLGSLTLPTNISFGELNLGTFFAQAAEVVDSGTCGDDLTWTLDDEGTLTISGTGEMEDYYTWPNEFGAPWTGNENVKSVIIEDGITYVGYNTFYYCPNLTSITIPASVTTFRAIAVVGCDSFNEIIVSDDSETYASEDGILFDKDMTTLIKCPTAKEGTVVIPDSVTSIGVEAFRWCSNVTSVTMPDGLIDIGEAAFQQTGLKSVTIPDSVTSIGAYAFASCKDLATVKLSENISGIASVTFGYCSSLTSIEIPDGVTGIGYDAFCGCSSLTSIEIPSSLVGVSFRAFSGCTALTDVYYLGSEEQWNEINIDDTLNNYLTDATIHYNTYMYQYAAGDVNLDGTTDYLDAMMILRYDAELTSLNSRKLSLADVNGDGSVDSLDAILILRYDSGLIDEF